MCDHRQCYPVLGRIASSVQKLSFGQNLAASRLAKILELDQGSIANQAPYSFCNAYFFRRGICSLTRGLIESGN